MLLTIANNRAFCKNKGMVLQQSSVCSCQGHVQHCSVCSGTGEFITTEFPFEIDMSNEDFDNFWNAMDRLPSDKGAIWPQMLLSEMQKVIKHPDDSDSMIRFKIIYSRFGTRIKKMCIIASQREEMIQYGDCHDC